MTRRPDLYLLCDIDCAWVHDGIRDRGDRREEMQTLFRAAVAATGTPTVLIAGHADARFALASAAIGPLIQLAGADR
jgi:nicotinamide riboside kinase